VARFKQGAYVLKKTITYTNPFTDQEVSEDHYFHISKADLVEMEMEEHGEKYMDKDGKELTGMQAKLQKIVDSEDGKAIMAEFKDIIRRSYGKKDGDRFLKSSAIWEDFQASEAFSQLLFDLCTNATAAAEFMNGVVPSNLDKVVADMREQAVKNPETAEKLARLDGAAERLKTESEPAAETPPRLLTKAEIEEMDSDELKSGLATGRYKLS
jgi:hypothetical protein